MKTLRSQLNFDESQAINFLTVKKILQHRVKDLKVAFWDLEDNWKKEFVLKKILPKYSNCVAVLLKAHIGKKPQYHWGTVIRNKKGKLFWWDSLGLSDASLNKVLKDNGKFVRFLHQNKIQMNRTKFQSSSRKIRTCGLHLCVRLSQFQLSNSEYNTWLRSMRTNADDLVALLTFIGHNPS